MKAVVMPAGTSVMANLRKAGADTESPMVTAALNRGFLDQLGESATELSAEIGTLAALGLGPGDRAILLSTDTDNGYRAAELVAHLAEHLFGVRPRLARIRGLVLDDADTFLRVGVHELALTIDKEVEEARTGGYDPVISVGAGINPVIPYAAVYAMLRRVPLCYRFHQSARLIYLPLLPVAFDYDLLQRAEVVLMQIERDSQLSLHEVRGRLGADYDSLLGLFEQVNEDQLTFSAFGHLLLSDLRQARDVEVYLSPAAASSLHAASGAVRAQYDFMLSRVRNPMWRAQKRHAFHGDTDLQVYKPGNTSQRMAAWTESANRIFVAELLMHDEYETRLPGRKASDYDRAKFVRWVPSDGAPVDVVSENERDGDRLLRALEEAERTSAAVVVRANKEIADAMTLATDLEKDLADVRRNLEVTRQNLDRALADKTELEAKLSAPGEPNMFQRLWRAVFPHRT